MLFRPSRMRPGKVVGFMVYVDDILEVKAVAQMTLLEALDWAGAVCSATTADVHLQPWASKAKAAAKMPMRFPGLAVQGRNTTEAMVL